MPVLTLLVGISEHAKSKKAMSLQTQTGAVLIQAAQIAQEEMAELQSSQKSAANLLQERVQKIVLQKMTEAMQDKRDVVLDAYTRSPKYRKPYLALARKFGCRLEAVWLNSTLEEAAEENPHVPLGTLKREQRLFQIPTYAEGFDRIAVETSEQVLPEAAAFFHDNEAKLIADPPGLIREQEQDGRLEAWLPELHRAIPIDQHNPHHRFTVYEHILKASEIMAGTFPKMVWTVLLHDIGKAYPGIKQFNGFLKENYGKWKKKDFVLIDNGADIREGRDTGEFYIVRGERIPRDLVNTDLAGHFYDHENVGAQMAYRILIRFGYSTELALEVATLIQFHMLMPRSIEDAPLPEIRKFYEKVAHYAADLMWVRLADDRGK